MNVSTFIARRYLFAKKSKNIINLISFISFFGLFVSSASLIIILSGFNGIQQYVEQMYGRHSPDIYIQPLKGKIIDKNHPIFKKIGKNKDTKYFSKVIEENSNFYVVNITAVKPTSPKTFEEAKGQLVADYQIELESRLINELRDKFKVNINQDVLAKVNALISN